MAGLARVGRRGSCLDEAGWGVPFGCPILGAWHRGCGAFSRAETEVYAAFGSARSTARTGLASAVVSFSGNAISS